MNEGAEERGSGFATDVLKLVSGSAIARVAGFALTPIVTRLYLPEAYGTAMLFASAVTIVGLVSCLRYELAIVLPKEAEEAANLLGLCLLLVAVVTAVVAIPAFLMPEHIGRWANSAALADLIYLFPVAVFGHGAYLALTYWNTRTKHFGRIAVADVSATVAARAIQIGVGLAWRAGAGGLIGAQVASATVVGAILGWLTWRDDGRGLRRTIRWGQMRQELGRYRKFPVFDAPSVFVGGLAGQLPVFLVAPFFTPAIVGYYALGYQVIRLPLDLIGRATSRVFFQRASEAQHGGDLAQVTEMTLRRLLSLGTLPILFLGIVGPQLFSLVFGANWAEAGVYTQIMALWIALRFVAMPLSMVLPVLQRQEIVLAYNLATLLLGGGGLLAGCFLEDPRLAVGLYAAGGFVTCCWYLVTILWLSGVSLARSGAMAAQYLVLWAPGIGAVWAATASVGAGAGIVAAAAVYATYLAIEVRRDKTLAAIANTVLQRTRWRGAGGGRPT